MFATDTDGAESGCLNQFSSSEETVVSEWVVDPTDDTRVGDEVLEVAIGCDTLWASVC